MNSCEYGHLGFLFDTVSFNRHFDVRLAHEETLGNCDIFVTQHQWKELSATKGSRKHHLLIEYLKLCPTQLEPNSLIWSTRERSPELLKKKLLERMNNKKKHRNNSTDADIGVTAIVNNLILVTNDKALFESVVNLGGQAMTYEQFAEEIET